MPFDFLPQTSLTDFFVGITHLGAEWVLWLLVALSVLSVTIIFERLIYFSLRMVRFNALVARLETLLKDGKVAEALKVVQSRSAPECRVAAAGLAQFGQSSEVVTETMLSAKARERTRLEAYLSILATLGNNAPFVGLLGTVLGIIKAAHDLAAVQGNQDTVASSAVMAGVFEALVATAVGLFVAIPAVVAYNFFQRRVRVRMGQVDSLAHWLLAWHARVHPAAEINTAEANSIAKPEQAIPAAKANPAVVSSPASVVGSGTVIADSAGAS